MARTKRAASQRSRPVKIPEDAAVWKPYWNSNGIKHPHGPPRATRKQTEKCFAECHKYIPKWVQQLRIGDEIELFINTTGTLQRTTVTNIMNNHIECSISYHGRIYLKKSNKSLIELNSKTLQYTNHSSPNISFEIRDKIIYYHSIKDNKNYLFIIVKGIGCIYRHDMKDNKSVKYCDFPKDFHPLNWSKYTWNQKESKIYFLLLDTTTAKCAIFDIEHKKWKILKYKCNQNDDIYGIVKIFYIPFGDTPNHKSNEIHGITECGHHLKFNPHKYPKLKVKNSKIDIVKDTHIANYTEPSFRDFYFIQSEQQLVDVYRHRGTKICICNIRPNQNKVKWKHISYNNIKYDKDVCETLLFDHILFIFYGKRVRCFDIFSQKLFECDKMFGEDIKLDTRWYSFLVNNGEIHLIKSVGHQSGHISLPLLDLIPCALNKEIINRNDMLVFGYIKQIENKRDKFGLYFPVYLKKLIVKFYPSFLF